MEENENYGELIQRRRDPNGETRSTARFLLVLLAIMFCVTILFTQIFNGVVAVSYTHLKGLWAARRSTCSYSIP